MATLSNKSTLEERIRQANEKHNFRYDYSLITEYKNVKEDVPIICPIHGIFHRSFDSHIHKGRGCPLCSKRPTYNKDLFVRRSNEVHNNFYDYSKVPNFDYGAMDKSTKVEVICPKHGSFPTTIYNHLQGYGCPKCGFESMAEKRAKPFEEFKKAAIKVHGGHYEYVEDTYVSMKKDMVMICPKHGEFLQKPIKHLHGHGCQKCKNSRLEEEMMLYLDENGIEYKLQYAPSFLKNGRGLQKLDFYLPQYNIAIECQGIQHFIESKYSRMDDIEKNQERDITKAEKCKEHGIDILYYTTEENMQYIDKCKIYGNMNTYCDLGETLNRIKNITNEKEE